MSNVLNVPEISSSRRPLLGSAAAVLGGAALARQLPSPADLLSAVPDLWSATSSRTPGDINNRRVDELVLSAAGALVWSVGLWIAMVAAIGIGTAVARRDLRAGRDVIVRLLPRAARGLVVAAIGGGALAASSGCAPAFSPGALVNSNSGTTSIRDEGFAVEFDLDWPVSPTPTREPAPDRSATAATAPAIEPGQEATSASPPTPPSALEPPTAGKRSREATVVVRPGDSLWSIAAAHLPASSTDAAVALAWPHWYAANHDLIGGDPDRIRPGWALVVPDLPVLAVNAPEEPS